jgi:hypothetical protein
MPEVVTKQLLWRGVPITIPVRLIASSDIEGIDSVVIPASSLKCTAVLVDANGGDIVPCENCIAAGMSSPLSYISWRVSTDSDMMHRLHYDIVILCNGEIDHSNRQVGILALCYM